MTNNPMQILIIILMMVFIPSVIWTSGRIVELIVNGYEDRVPKFLQWLAQENYVRSIRQGERNQWKLLTTILALALPLITLCSASTDNFFPRLKVVLTAAVVFFAWLIVLEWLVRPRNHQNG